MADETITYELIRRIQLEEQRIPKLTRIPENFFKSVDDYVRQKRQMSLRDDRKNVFELKNLERLVENVYSRREEKILKFALTAAKTNMLPENLLEEEKKFFNSLVESIKRRREENLKRILAAEKKEEATMVVFKEEVPEFVGSDTKSYGPFRKGDIAKLPEDNMKILVERGIAEEFKVAK